MIISKVATARLMGVTSFVAMSTPTRRGGSADFGNVIGTLLEHDWSVTGNVLERYLNVVRTLLER